MKTISLLSCFLLAGVASAGSRDACDRCDNLTVAEQLDRADVVFAGEAFALSEDFAGCGETGNFNYAMIAKEVFKGQVGERINVTSPEPEDPCGVEMMERGVEYLVFAEESDIGEVKTDVCWIVKPQAEATAELEEFGDSYPPEDAGGCSSMLLPRVEWLLVLGLGGIWTLRRFRRSGGAR